MTSSQHQATDTKDWPRQAQSISPDYLADIGALVTLEWSVPAMLAAGRRGSPASFPAPILGYAVVDTGASHSCIAEDVAADLGLHVTRRKEGYGAGGKLMNNLHIAQLSVAFADARGNSRTVTLTREFQAVPQLGAPWARFNLQLRRKPARIVALLGRDVLRHTMLEFRGCRGGFDLALDVNSFKARPELGWPQLG